MSAEDIKKMDRQVDWAFKTSMALAGFAMSILYYNISDGQTVMRATQINTSIEVSSIKQKLEDHILESQRRSDDLKQITNELKQTINEYERRNESANSRNSAGVSPH